MYKPYGLYPSFQSGLIHFLFFFSFFFFFFFFFVVVVVFCFISFRIEISISKKWRPWSDFVFCAVWTGSALFLIVKMGRYRSSQMNLPNTFQIYTDTKKKSPLYIYVCLFQTNAAILFNYFASITLMITHQTKIHSMVISANNNAANTSTQISKVTKINISCVLHFPWPSQYIPVSLNGHTVELLWVPSVFLAITTAGINLPRKSGATKRRSQPSIVTRRRYLAGRSVWTPVALNISQRWFSGN